MERDCDYNQDCVVTSVHKNFDVTSQHYIKAVHFRSKKTIFADQRQKGVCVQKKLSFSFVVVQNTCWYLTNIDF